ncbi:MAG: hypothetical protein NTZ33_02225 [Bacteroidetes bacterium]|nr:hypothetical protein [Bacteroidota bacterium]
MKTRNFFMLLFVIAIAGFLTTSCKKDAKDEKFDSTSLQQLSKDEVTMESSFNDAVNDANIVVTGSNGGKSILSLPCNATVVTSFNGSIRTDTVTFNGLNCANNKYKTGKIVLQRDTTIPWSQASSTIQISFINLKVERAPMGIPNGNWVILNGTKTWQNVNGGLVKNLTASSNPVVFKLQGAVQATFNNNTTRTWNVARQLTYTGTYPLNLLLSIEGFGTAGGYTNLVTWGINRHGENFYTQINQAIVLKQQCGWDPISGVKVHQIPADSKTATITFGYDINNLPITNGACPDKYKVDWVKGNNTGTVFILL